MGAGTGGEPGDVYFMTEVIVDQTGHVDVCAEPGDRVMITIWPTTRDRYVLPNPIIRGESEPVIAGAGTPRRRFIDWWSSKSRSNEIPDFLRKEAR